jgi:hypothetical protein
LIGGVPAPVTEAVEAIDWPALDAETVPAVKGFIPSFEPDDAGAAAICDRDLDAGTASVSL